MVSPPPHREGKSVLNEEIIYFKDSVKDGSENVKCRWELLKFGKGVYVELHKCGLRCFSRADVLIQVCHC